MMRFAMKSVLMLLLLTPALWAQAPMPRANANDNRAAAGTLEDGVLTLRLDITRAMWHPDADNDPGADVLAFAESGRAPSIPGPLIRVPVGTNVRTSVHNTLTESIVVFGLSGARAVADSVRIQPGETRELATTVTTPGTFFYRGLTHGRAKGQDARIGDDMMLGGALVVDDAATSQVKDRVLVIFQWLDSLRLKPSEGTVDEVLTINGKSWPHTERLSYKLGETIRWRVINASFDVHPMHLHGAYFNVLSRGGLAADSIYAPDRRRQTVTERMLPLTTMLMEWKPERAGNWVFHCHLNFHIMPHPQLGGLKASKEEHHVDHTQHGMGGLVLGTSVMGPVTPDATARRQLRLVVQEYDSIAGEVAPRFSYRFDDEKKMTLPGAPFIVTRDEPIAITVVNRATEPTSVHWHGLEIESYFDGVPGFGGHPGRITPMVGVNDSFVVKMRPPRAGTFIYHAHADEARQQAGGLYGAFIVLDKDQQWDAEHERLIVLSNPRDTTFANSMLINGEQDAVIEMKAGETYRLRIINITLEKPSMIAWLKKDDKVVDWKLVARDGADLPAHEATVQGASLQITIGQTFDALFTPTEPGNYSFEARRGNGAMLRAAKVVVK
jgi:manganese oxidase